MRAYHTFRRTPAEVAAAKAARLEREAELADDAERLANDLQRLPTGKRKAVRTLLSTLATSAPGSMRNRLATQVELELGRPVSRAVANAYLKVTE